MADMSNMAGSLEPINARAEVQVSRDKLTATITLYEPLNDGMPLLLEDLKASLEQKLVVFGIDDDALETLEWEPVYAKPVIIARGRPSVAGTDASLQYFVELHRKLKPREREDGSVDFRDLGLIESVEKDDLLCRKTPATSGVPGSDVFGAPIPAKAGKDCTIPNGKNTVLSEDKLELRAAITGQVCLIENKVNVLDTFTVNGDVSTATGDIKFSGNVVVKGGVTAGFLVQAAGNVDISGVVESAKIIAGGSLIIRGGFSGGTNGTLNADGNLTCRFIQGGQVTVGGNLETTYIMNSIIHCCGEVNLSGKGLIVGGHVTAQSKVSANFIGSANSAAVTVVEVGTDPELAKRIRALPKELETCAKNMASLEMMIKSLMQLKAAGKLTPDKVDVLQKSLRYMLQLKDTQSKLVEESAQAQEKLLDMSRGSVKVSKAAYPGVKIIIGPEQLPLQSVYKFVTFTRTPDGISTSPLK